MNSFIYDIFEKIAAEASTLIQRGADRCQTPPPRRTCQACRLRGNQGCHQIQLRQMKMTLSYITMLKK